MTGVVIHEIYVDADREEGTSGIEWRYVPQLVRELKIWLPKRVQIMASEEYIFLHGIPWDCIRGTEELN